MYRGIFHGLIGLWLISVSWAVDPSSSSVADVRNGIDVLQRDGFRKLAGKRVGLITNHTGINRDGVSTVELLDRAPQVQLVALFSPEHGFAGTLDQSNITDATDASTGLQIFSLYGETRTPTPEMLAGIDALVFDIQDIGARFYTYISTMGGAMRAAAKHDVEFIVLDRVNPIGGTVASGPVLDEGSESFVGYHPISVRHGMTAGELAMMFRDEWQSEVKLSVVPAKGWTRDMMFDQTGLLWVNPSPNMRSLTQAFLYPGVGLLETTNLSVGRGTDTPFEVIGAPWIDERHLASELNSKGLAGIRFVPIRFTPDSSKYQDEECGGVNLIIVDREAFKPVPTGLAIAVTLRKQYRKQWQTKSLNRLLSSKKTYESILTGAELESLMSDYRQELDEFRARREKYLLYDVQQKTGRDPG